ncbi:dolichol kinase [Caerostris darwini]|uniref:dolichol kinase n=1 Tax=Caerostris darwini TaxID=1538125 RepID=A0AAV4SDC8_9ARAC|nr:dolichol kinase [Caerostris darwini]
MEYKIRTNAGYGFWCYILLLFCLFPFMIRNGPGIYTLLFNVCLCCCLTPVFKENPRKISSWLRENVPIMMLSLPPSLFMSYFFAYNFLFTYSSCVLGVLYYSHLVNKLLLDCPGSFTYGEAQIISQGVTLFLLHSVITLLSKLHAPFNFPVIKAIPESVLCLQILLLGTFLLVHVLCIYPNLRQGIKFFFCCIIFSCIMMLMWQVILNKNIFVWMWLYCLRNRKRVILLLWWLMSTFAAVIFVVWVNQKPNYKASTLARKYFHLIVCVVYIPGILYDLDFLRLASGIALTAFIVLEMFRILKIPLIGPAIEDAFRVFLDEKDTGVLILTNIYLLLGCSSSVWLAGVKKYHICLLSGIISVGLGDTAASVGGTFFGKHHWKSSKKTYEGTICAVIVQLVASLYFLSIGHVWSTFNIVVVILAVLFTSLLEALTSQVDNLILPLFMFSFFCWI